MSEYTIGEPTAPPSFHQKEKYSELLEKVAALKDGSALPLTFQNYGDAGRFVNTVADRFKRRGVRVQQRGNVIYLSKREMDK